MSFKKMLMLLSVLLIWLSLGWISSTYILEYSGLILVAPVFRKLRSTTIFVGLFLLFLSAMFFVASRLLREEKRISKYIRCRVCGRKIPFDMVICPYCFSDVRERKNELD